jgi:hypothetical protein
MIFVIAIKERNCVLNVYKNIFRAGQTVCLGWAG